MRRRKTYCAAGCLLLAAGAAAGMGGQKYPYMPGDTNAEHIHAAGSRKYPYSPGDAVSGMEETGDLSLYGCAAAAERNHEEAGTADILTERQKRILRERHLPENYEELTALQKESIRTIEELLRYLEEKYKRSFVFAEYHPPSVLEPDTVSMLFREEGNSRSRAAVIRRTSTGKEVRLSDDFPAVAAESVLEEALKSYVFDRLHIRCKVFGFISRAELEQPPDTLRQLEGVITADTCIWLSDEAVTKQKAEEFAESLEEWLFACDIEGRCQVMLLEKEDWNRVNSRDYARFFAEDVCLFRKIIRIT